MRVVAGALLSLMVLIPAAQADLLEGFDPVVCVNTGRNFIGIERDDKYFAIASDRIAAAQKAAA